MGGVIFVYSQWLKPEFLLQLEELPVAIGCLQNLQTLNLCNNRLTSLPSELGLLKKLNTLHLGLNQLRTLPSTIDELTELRNIGLSDNRFTSVPACLSRLSKLEKINMDRNPIRANQPEVEKPPVVCKEFHLIKQKYLCNRCLKRYEEEQDVLQFNTAPNYGKTS